MQITFNLKSFYIFDEKHAVGTRLSQFKLTSKVEQHMYYG